MMRQRALPPSALATEAPVSGRAIPAAERDRKLNLLAQALVNARGVPDPANRALKFANIGEGLLDLGEVERATNVLRQGTNPSRRGRSSPRPRPSTLPGASPWPRACRTGRTRRRGG